MSPFILSNHSGIFKISIQFYGKKKFVESIFYRQFSFMVRIIVLQVNLNKNYVSFITPQFAFLKILLI